MVASEGKSKAKGKGQPRNLSTTMGAVIAGFDQQIFRALPPPHELVKKGCPVRGLSGEPGDLEIVLPPTVVPANDEETA